MGTWKIRNEPVGHYICSSELKTYRGLEHLVPLEGKLRVLNQGRTDVLKQLMGGYVAVEDIGTALFGENKEYVEQWMNDPTRVNEEITPSLKYYEHESPGVSLFELLYFTYRLFEY